MERAQSDFEGGCWPVRGMGDTCGGEKGERVKSEKTTRRGGEKDEEENARLCRGTTVLGGGAVVRVTGESDGWKRG